MVTAAQKKAADDKAAADLKADEDKQAAAKKEGRDGESIAAGKDKADTVTKTDDGGNTTQVDKDLDKADDSSIAQPEAPLQPRTVEGKDGVERLIEGPTDGWEPAQVEPTEGEVAAAEARVKAEEERKNRRTSEHPADRDNGNDA